MGVFWPLTQGLLGQFRSVLDDEALADVSRCEQIQFLALNAAPPSLYH